MGQPWGSGIAARSRYVPVQAESAQSCAARCAATFRRTAAIRQRNMPVNPLHGGGTCHSVAVWCSFVVYRP